MDGPLYLSYRPRCNRPDTHNSATRKVSEKILTCLRQKDVKQYSLRMFEHTVSTKLDSFSIPEETNMSQTQFSIWFSSYIVNVHEEMLIHDEIWLLGSLGGSLGLFIGFSLFDYASIILEKIVDLLYKMK